jgi:hypothetical protein
MMLMVLMFDKDETPRGSEIRREILRKAAAVKRSAGRVPGAGLVDFVPTYWRAVGFVALS